jgi:hypothetical protein
MCKNHGFIYNMQSESKPSLQDIYLKENDWISNVDSIASLYDL